MQPNIFILAGLLQAASLYARTLNIQQTGESRQTGDGQSYLTGQSRHTGLSYLAGALTSASSHQQIKIPAGIRAESRPPARRKRSVQTKLCGNFLMEMLYMVCMSGKRKKRESEPFNIFQIYYERDQLASYADNSQTQFTGLSDSCCKKACSITTLQAACTLFY